MSIKILSLCHVTAVIVFLAFASFTDSAPIDLNAVMSQGEADSILLEQVRAEGYVPLVVSRQVRKHDPASQPGFATKIDLFTLMSEEELATAPANEEYTTPSSSNTATTTDDSVADSSRKERADVVPRSEESIDSIVNDDSSEDLIDVPTLRSKRSWYYLPSRG